jgi:tetratricopeptide (TPR) repeat protein
MRKLFFLIFTFYSFVNCYSQTFSRNLGYAYEKQWYKNDYRGALDEYNKAIELDTTDCSYLYMVRGELKFILKDYNGAIADYDVAIKNNHDCNYSFGGEKEGQAILETGFAYDYKLYFIRGNAKIELEDYRGAIADYNKSIEIDPNDSETFRNRGNAKIELEDYRGAIADFNKAIQIDPNNTNAHKNRGYAKYRLQDYRGAITDYTKVIAITPSNGAYFLRGYAKFDLKDYQGAILDYNKAIGIDPNDAGAYFNRGLAKIKLKQKNSGCLDFSKAGELGYEDAYEAIKRLCN